jgi:hypothetical protein
MRIWQVALILGLSIFVSARPSKADPIFILNCRLINTNDWLFRQHCKAQESECGSRSCFVRTKQKAKSHKAIQAAHAAETPLAATDVPADAAGSLESPANQPSDGVDNQSSSIGSGDTSSTSGDEGSLSDNAGTSEGAEGPAVGSEGTGEQGAAATGSDAEGADGKVGADPASNISDGS